MRYVLLLLFICNASPNAFAQHVGIKNDVLWDAAMMPNLGVELSMNRHVTVDLWGGGECWDYTNGTQLKLYLFQPELRYWPCQKFEGHFFGIHAHAAHFNVGLISFISELKQGLLAHFTQIYHLYNLLIYNILRRNLQLFITEFCIFSPCIIFISNKNSDKSIEILHISPKYITSVDNLMIHIFSSTFNFLYSFTPSDRLESKS